MLHPFAAVRALGASLMLLLLLWSAPIVAASALALPASTALSGVPLAGTLALLRDPGGSLSLADVRAADAAGRFTQLPDNLAAGFSREVFWLRFRLDLPASTPQQRWLLEVQPTMLDELTLYSPQADGHYRQQLGGDHLPPNARELPYRYTVFPLLLSGQPGTATFYLRLHSSSTVVARPTLYSEAGFIAHSRNEHLLLGLFWGIAGLILLFCMVIWRWLGEHRYLLYALHLGGILLNQFCANGLGHLLLWPDWSMFNDRLTSYAPAIALASGIWYLCEFTRLGEHFPRLDRALRASGIGILLLALPALFGEVQRIATPYYLLSLLLTLGVPVLLTLAWLKRTPETALYVVGFSLFNVGAIALALRNLGWLPGGFWIDNGLQIGTLLYLLLFHLGLVMRIREAELARLREQEQAQERELAAAQRAEQLLEENIRTRTGELHATNVTLRQREQELQLAKEQAEQAAATERQAREEQAQLLALIAHEFRSPLAAIGNTAQSLRRVLEADSNWVRAKGEKIFGAVTRLSSVIDNSLSDARLESAERPLQAETVQLADFLERLFQSYRQDTLHRWQLTPPNRHLTVVADPGLLDLALSNLLDNARKYAPAGSPIELCANFEGDFAYIEVRDQGPGIDPALQADIFKKFFRGDTRGQKGTGLGLYLVKRIADMHGGSLSLSSQPGHGATFRLQLPLHPSP